MQGPLAVKLKAHFQEYNTESSIAYSKLETSKAELLRRQVRQGIGRFWTTVKLHTPCDTRTKYTRGTDRASRPVGCCRYTCFQCTIVLRTVVQYSSTCKVGFCCHCSRAGNAYIIRLYLRATAIPSAATNAMRVHTPYSRTKLLGWKCQHSPDTSHGAASIPTDSNRHDKRVARSQRKGSGGGDTNEQHTQKDAQLLDNILLVKLYSSTTCQYCYSRAQRPSTDDRTVELYRPLLVHHLDGAVQLSLVTVWASPSLSSLSDNGTITLELYTIILLIRTWYQY